MPDSARGFEFMDNPLAPESRSRHRVGMTVREVARHYRVGEDKVRRWISRGELPAINTAAALCGRPRWVIMPEGLSAFEKGRRGGPVPKAQRRRRPQVIDFYPD